MRTVPRVIVWINGAFGVGKTSVAEKLVQLWDGATLVDPERIGFEQIDRCAGALTDPRFAVHVGTEGLSIEDVARRVLHDISA